MTNQNNKNLLECWPRLSEEDRRNIAFAIRNYSPNRDLNKYKSFAEASRSPLLPLLRQSLVITALHSGFGGTANDIIKKITGEAHANTKRGERKKTTSDTKHGPQ